MGVVELAINGVLALLLVGVIASCWMLHRRLETIRSGQGELRQLIDQLNRATSMAQSSIGEFKRASVEARDDLTGALAKAKAMKDELTLVTEAADSLASRIEQKITRESERVREAESRRDAGSGASEDAAARRDLLNALKEAR